jgi:sec-independent protein translocase protein TatB
MNGTLFGVGPLEVLVIGILILLVLGPERLPELTRQMGRALRRLRQTYVAFTQEFKDELQPIAQDIDEVTRELRQEVAAIREAADLRSVLQPYADDISKAAQLNGAPAQNGMQTLPQTPPAAQPSATAAPASHNGASDSANIIAPPGASSSISGSARGNDTQPRTNVIVQLSDDNPWASVDAPIRSDQLDDDSPWRS